MFVQKKRVDIFLSLVIFKAGNIFLATLRVHLSKFVEDTILLGGDFNIVFNSKIDPSNWPLPADRTLSAAFDDFRNTLGLTDIWICVNPAFSEYTFYSKANNSYSRIDYILGHINFK
uniref:Endonuclease/exonuclease/phosphatase domain-containing protein n=1 Tax=Scophthalmus maximus TaxID=52904 RepID=A0A8D3DVT4_SCOMX